MLRSTAERKLRRGKTRGGDGKAREIRYGERSATLERKTVPSRDAM